MGNVRNISRELKYLMNRNEKAMLYETVHMHNRQTNNVSYISFTYYFIIKVAFRFMNYKVLKSICGKYY